MEVWWNWIILKMDGEYYTYIQYSNSMKLSRSFCVSVIINIYLLFDFLIHSRIEVFNNLDFFFCIIVFFYMRTCCASTPSKNHSSLVSSTYSSASVGRSSGSLAQHILINLFIVSFNCDCKLWAIIIFHNLVQQLKHFHCSISHF